MKKWTLTLLLVSLGAWAQSQGGISALLQEFMRRDQIKLTPEQGAAINFLKALKYPVEKIEELEILAGNDQFVLKDKDGNVCMGEISKAMLRCKNVMGMTTVLFSGDSD